MSAKQSVIEKSLSIARVLRHFVLVPCEICVVPFGHWKIAPDRNDISLANIGSTSFKSCRWRLNCIIVESILNRQADYISSSIRLAAYTSTRRKAPLDVAAGQPGLRLINKYHTCLRVAKLLQAWLSIPPKILPIRSHFRRKLHLFDFSRRNARDKSGVASPRFPGR